MHLKDTFLAEADEPQPEPEHHSASTVRAALRGIGDPMQRQRDDFVMSFGGNGEAPQRDWKVGDNVEFMTPDGQKRHGALARPQGDSDWIVEIDDNTYNVVPTIKLRAALDDSRGEKRLAIRDILANTDEWLESRKPEQIGEHDFRATINYGSLNKEPSNAAVCAYIERTHGGRVLDAVVKVGGKMDVYYTTKTADLVSPSDPESTEQPGVETEELEGTGKVGYVAESLKRTATLNPQYDFVTNQIVEDDSTVTATFSLQASNGDPLYINRRGNITPVISDDAVQAVGYIEYDGAELRGALHGPDGEVALDAYGLNVQAGVEAPYSSGDGPLGTREDEPDGQYAIKAESDGPATEEDGEVREEIAGPGQVVAVDQNAKDYYKEYYGKGQHDYGEMLTRDIVAAFILNQDREPTADELKGTLKVTASLRYAAMPKEAQMVPMRDFITQLMQAGQQNEDLKRKMDKMLAGYISSNPSQVLDKLDPTAYPRTLYMMMQDPSKGYAKKLQRLHGANIDLSEHVKAPSADDWNGGGDKPQSHPELAQDLEAPAEGEPPPAKPGMMDKARDLMRKVMPGDRAVDKAIEEAEAEEAAAKARDDAAMAKGPIPRHDLVQDLPNPAPGVKPKQPVTAARMQPAKGDMGAMHPRIEKLTGQGSYMVLEVVWDADSTETMSTGNIRHQLISWVKGLESMKEYRDVGTLGKPRFKEFDPDLGMAVMLVRSSEAKNLPQEVVHNTEGEDGNASA